MVSSDEIQRSLETANRYLLRTENEQIDAYVKRHNLNVAKTGTGLRYVIRRKGNGTPVKRGEVVKLNYKVKFLTGDVVYTSDDKGVKTFTVGRGGVEAGLEEAVLLLRRGDIATIILPSHLAFGLLGDDDKIPPRTSLVYEIEILY
ncbi:MAG: FKBP-type peptidyl-prolyl cis-trans isomerase [Bacteroidales bacterium]|jgi:FKBP-type peptidyl-prolyl cis-trans isomerase|nr:FKBP-type peptidyl-prolyl cis-trans isomerase [Bacteroidales bacterium]